MYVDPTCCHTWQALPQAAELQREFAGRIAFAYVSVPLNRGPEEFDAQGTRLYRRKDMAAHLAEVALAMGRPVSLRNWEIDLVPTSWTAGEAWLAARRQGTAAGNRYFEAQVEAVMRRGDNIGRAEVLLELARTVGLDVDRLQADLADPGLPAELEALVAAARAAGIHSRPTLVLTGTAGREHWVVGPQPYETVRGAAAAALADVATGPPVKTGGRILEFDDLAAEGRQAVPGGWRLELRVSTGRPGEQKVPVYQAVRLFQPAGAWGPGVAEALLREAWGAALPLVLARGRDAAGAPVYLVGVRAAGPAPVKAGATAEERAVTLQKLAALVGAPLTEPGTDALRWLDGLLALGDGPLVTLKWVPGAERSGPCPPELAPCGVLVLADPLPPNATQEEERRLRGLEREWQQLPPGPDRDDSLAVLRRELERIGAARRVGAWESWAAGFYPPGREAEGFRAAEAAWEDRSELFPLRSVLVQGHEAAHLRRHAAAFTLCRELELHGASWWNSQLVSSELARFM